MNKPVLMESPEKTKESKPSTNDFNELLGEISLVYGSHMITLLDRMFKAYVVSDEFCRKNVNGRIEDVYSIEKLKEIISSIGSMISSRK